MRRNRIYPVLFFVFGALCFMLGFLFSNYLLRNKKSLNQDRYARFHTGLINSSILMVYNCKLSFKIIDDVSMVWRRAIENNKNFNQAIQSYLSDENDTFEKLKYFNKEIEIELSKEKNCPPEYLESHIALMDVYSVYSQVLSLAREPAGSFLEFNEEANKLKNEFSRTLSSLKIYLPELNKLLGQQQQDTSVKLNKSSPPLSLIDPFDNILQKDMKLAMVEKLIGVPKEKKKDTLKREVWVYPCQKSGLYNRVYFISDRVVDWR